MNTSAGVDQAEHDLMKDISAQLIDANTFWRPSKPGEVHSIAKDGDSFGVCGPRFLDGIKEMLHFNK